MSFSGKKFRRVACENIEQLAVANADEYLAYVLRYKAPVFSFTRLDVDTFVCTVEMDGRVATNTFKLGREFELERNDGYKVKITYTLESENVLNQVIKQPDGKITYFRREFGENETKMTITVEGTNIEAKIYYEVVN